MSAETRLPESGEQGQIGVERDPLQPRTGMPLIARDSKRLRNLYRGRAAVERESGTLKHRFGLAPLAVEDWLVSSFMLT